LPSATISWLVDRLRKALNPSASTLGGIPAFDVDISHELYNKLLKPVAPGWRDARSLLFVAHGALGRLPLSVLVTQPTELAEGSGVLFSNYKKVPWLSRDQEDLARLYKLFNFSGIKTAMSRALIAERTFLLGR
jgi:hypothetical protein